MRYLTKSFWTVDHHICMCFINILFQIWSHFAIINSKESGVIWIRLTMAMPYQKLPSLF